MEDGARQTSRGGLAVAADPLAAYAARSSDAGLEIGVVVDGGFSAFGTTKGSRAMVLGGNALYVADDVVHVIRKITFKGSATVIASTPTAPHDLVVDGTQLFYTTTPAQNLVGTLHRIGP